MKPAAGMESPLGDGTLFAVIFVCVLVATVAIAALLPAHNATTFRSTTRLMLNFKWMEKGFDAERFHKEIEVMRSDSVLQDVVEQLALDQAWRAAGSAAALSTNDAVALLRERTSLRPVRNSTIVEIEVSEENSAQAADVANAIAESYRRNLLKRVMQQLSEPIVQLEAQRTEVALNIHNAEVELQRLRLQEGSEEQLQAQTQTLGEMREELADLDRKLANATENSRVDNTMQAVILDRAAAGTRRLPSAKRQSLALGIVVGTVLGSIGGIAGILIRRSRMRENTAARPRGSA
ncbi:MAG TPA: hypothetical protein VEH04_05635 [Verrucomicrobiae bacterium]|nr:hypothetical protein [Verrucomicrobiae bacterium]